MNGYKYGAIERDNIESAPVASASVIQPGDLVWQDTGASNSPKAAADKAWNASLAGTQEDFHDAFLGVAVGRSQSGETDEIKVLAGGVFEFDCAAATFKIGDLVGPAKQTGNAIESQKVVAVATANLAIGRVVRNYASNTTKVLVEIVSTVVRSGPLAMA